MRIVFEAGTYRRPLQEVPWYNQRGIFCRLHTSTGAELAHLVGLAYEGWVRI